MYRRRLRQVYKCMPYGRRCINLVYGMYISIFCLTPLSAAPGREIGQLQPNEPHNTTMNYIIHSYYSPVIGESFHQKISLGQSSRALIRRRGRGKVWDSFNRTENRNLDEYMKRGSVRFKDSY